MPFQPVSIPSDAINSTVEPANQLSGLLTDLNLLGVPADAGQGLAVLESTATNLTKWWGPALAALGGGTAVLGAINGFWGSLDEGPRSAVIGGSALVLAAAVIGIAIIINADVRARAQGQAATFAARAEITKQFLELSYAASAAAAAATAAPQGGGQSAGGAGTVSCCSCDDIQKLTDPLKDSLAALTASVGALPDDGDSVQQILAALQSAVGDVPKHNALVTLGALQAVVPDAKPIVIKVAGTGFQGQLKSVDAGPIGPNSSKLHVRVDDGSQIAAIAVEDVTDF
jgi:hypothetical protein